MPTPRPSRTPAVTTRAAYTRTNADLLVNDPDGFPSDFPPVHWVGLDSGGGSYPIGPNGPWQTGWAPGQSVVTRATALITGPLTSAPFKVVELGFGGQPLGRPRWITDPCLTRPDARFPADLLADAAKLSRGNFWASWVRAAIHWGTGAFLCVEDEQGQPSAGSLRLVDPLLLSTERANDGTLRWVIGSEGAQPEDKVIFDRDGRVTLGAYTYRIVTLRNPHTPTDVDGHTPGVFEQHPMTFRLGGQITTFESGTFRSGIPAGYLKVDQTMSSMTQQQADELKRKWLASHGGDRRSIAVLNAFTSFVPLNLSPVDAALGEVKRLNIAEVAFAFGLDPEILGTSLSNSATYKNAQEYWSRHRDFGLAPWIAVVEDTLTALLPGTVGGKVDLDRFSNPPLKERVATGVAAVNGGLMTADEWRESEGLPPLPKPDPVPVPLALEQPEPESVKPSPAPAPSPTDIRSKRPAALR